MCTLSKQIYRFSSSLTTLGVTTETPFIYQIGYKLMTTMDFTSDPNSQNMKIKNHILLYN